MKGLLATVIAMIMSLFGAQQPSQTPTASFDARAALAAAERGETLPSQHLAAATPGASDPSQYISAPN